LARAAAALAPDLAGSARPAPATATVPLWLAATAQPAAWSAPILTAAGSWKAGKRVQAFDDLVAGMKEAFPSVVPGLPALLTDAVMPSHARMNDADWVDSERFYQRFGGERTKANLRSPQAVLAFYRSMCVAEKAEMPHQELDRAWRMLIELWQKCHGPDLQRDSLAWRWLGDALAAPAEAHNPFSDNLAEERKNAVRVIKAYERSIEADDSNEAAWLGLVSYLIRQGDTKRSNKMLDELVKKFPRNKGILMLAGDKAIARKSYPKGIAILRTALALDPLDRALKERIVVALTLRVREASRKGAPAAALWAEIEPLLENNPPAGHDMLSRWMARVRRSLLETEPEAAAQAEADAIALAPSALLRLFFSTTLASVYRVPPRKEWEYGWIVARSSPECTWKSLLEMLRVLDFTTAISGWGWKQTDMASGRVLKVAEHLLAPSRLQQDPTGLLGLIDELAAPRKGRSQPVAHAIGLMLRDISDTLDEQVSPGSKKADPHLRMACLLLDHCAPEEALKHLKSIIANAEAAGLPAVAARAREVQKEIENRNSRQPFGFSDDEEDPWDDEEGEDDDPWGDEDDEESNGEQISVGKCMDELEKAIDAEDLVEIAKTRSELLKLGMPPRELDMVIDALLAARKLSRSRKTAKAKKPAKNPDAGPRQIDLF
jgi:tetratricopeptide (TPR) repeat protein